jgi:shikimate dehydrogenase
MVAKTFAVLGSPIGHSKSPAIHQAAYAELGLPWQYDRFEVGQDDFGSFLIDGHGLAGMSITMPLKELAYEHALGLGAELDDYSRLLTASNTLTFSDGALCAYNTDVFGVIQTIRNAELPSPSTLAILGSGATSRSVLVGLAETFESLGSVTIFSRNRETAQQVIAITEVTNAPLDDIQWLPLEAAADFGGADLTCNTLPAAVANDLEVDVPIQGGFLFDVAYNPWPSQLSMAWRPDERISGLEMLLWQALAQIRIFVNGDVNVAVENEGHVFAAMRAAALAS